MPKEWVIADPWPDRHAVAERLRLSPTAVQAAFNRGARTDQQITSFLEPRLRDLHRPELIAGLPEAVERLAAAIRARKRIVIYGDYDVDGITGVAILWRCLKLAGCEPEYYIPHRLEEGYGLNSEAIAALAAQGAEVIVSVDCGITALEPAALARQRGVELIVTDHHQPHPNDAGDPILPDAAVVHPGLGPSPVNADLSGAGVALKLAWALASHLSGGGRAETAFREFLVEATGLAALGLVADVVPLTGENRILACHGLRGLPRSALPGVRALIEAAGLVGERLTGYDIGFKIAPRLNAVGRMGHARLAVELLTRADADEAARIARHLEQLNRARRTLERQILAEAEALLRTEGQDATSCPMLVLAAPGWHAGVLGIVAARLVDAYGKPAIMIGLENGQGQGSGRSVAGFALNEALAACGDKLLGFGGHRMAAGLRISADRVTEFTQAMHRYAAGLLTGGPRRETLRLDEVTDLRQLDERVVLDLARLEPFGCENPAPRLATGWVALVGEPRAVGGSGEHLQLTVNDRGARFKAIAFGQARQKATLCDRRRCRLAFQPIINTFNGRRSVELQVADFQFDDPA